MNEKLKVYKCPICDNIIELIEGDIKHIICCGQKMEEMKVNTSDGPVEKHVPISEQIDNEIIVKVGEITHPMEEDHYIMWVAEVTKNKTIRVKLKPQDNPEVKFPYIKGATLYAYCNKHGLWKNIIK